MSEAYNMTKKQDAEPIWYQIIVTDQEGLSGASVVAFVEPIIRTVAAKMVMASDLLGSCPELKDYEGQLLSPDEFLQKAATAIQFDWAFFFLYSTVLTLNEVGVTSERSEMLRADLTIRLADDYYFYVYSQDQKIMSYLREVRPDSEYKTGTFAELDIPD